MTWMMLPLALILAISSSALAEPAPSVLVTTAPVKSGSIERSITAYGTVQAGPGASDTLAVAYAGIVKRVDVVPGASVHRGQAIALIGTAPSAQSTYVQAEAALRAAKQTLAHTRALVASHLATRMQLGQAEQAATSALSARNALRREGADRATAPIVAPYDGIVAAIAVAPGAQLLPGAAIATVLRGDALVATVGLDPFQAGQVRASDKVAVIPVAGNGRGTLRGVVLAVSTMVNPQSGLVDATIKLPPAHVLVGEQVTARIDIGSARGIIVPRDAALPDGHGYTLWQVKSGHATPVPVDVRASAGNSSVVSGRIDPALPIVTTGNYQLTPGIAVRVQR